MRTEATNEALLREVVRGHLNEIGPEVRYGDSLSNVFVKPVSDAIKVVGAEAGKLTTRAKTAVAAILSRMGLLFLPWVDDDLKGIYDAEEKAMQRIMQQNASVYNRIDQSLKGKERLLFLIDPAAAIALNYVAAPVAMQFAKRVGGQRLQSLVDGRKFRKDPDVDAFARESMTVESKHRLTEDSTAAMRKFFEDPSVRAAINGSPIIKKARAAAVEALKDSTKKLVDLAKSVEEVSSIDELEKMTGRTVDRSAMEAVPDERDSIEQLSLAQFKQKVKKSIVDSLKSKVGLMKIADNSQLSKFYAQVAQGLIAL